MATKNQLRVPDTNHEEEHSLRDKAITFVLGLLGLHAGASNKADNRATNGNHPDMKENEPKPVRGRYVVTGQHEVGNKTVFETRFDENAPVLSDELAKVMLKDPALRKFVAKLRPDILPK